MSAPLQRREQSHDGDHESLRHKVAEKLAGSRYFALSLTIHVLIVALAGTIVIYKTYIEPDEFTAGSYGIVAPIDATTEPESPQDTLLSKPDAAQPPVVAIPDFPIVTTTAPVSNAAPIYHRPFSGTIAMPGNIGRDGVGKIPLVARGLPVEFWGRIGDGRWKVPEQRRPTKKSEAAVLRGLEWLRLNQNNDGSWGDKNKAAMTGLALLCFLGHGETPESPQYGFTVNKGVQWLIDNGTKFQGRLGMEDRFTQQGVYEHGIATYALGEYFSMTQDERVIELLRQAVSYIVQGQGPGGGWMYSFDKTANDLSVSGWQIQALKAAHLTKLNLPGVDPALDKAMSYIESVKGPKGGYGYRGPEDRYSLSGVGILSRLFWKGEHGELRKGLDWVLDETEKNKPVKYKSEHADLYAWYYHTQACLMFGGAAWTKWNRWFQDEIVDAQSTDGSWPVTVAKGHGPQAENSRTGAVYRTTLCVLMLEVFYRYMPATR